MDYGLAIGEILVRFSVYTVEFHVEVLKTLPDAIGCARITGKPTGHLCRGAVVGDGRLGLTPCFLAHFAVEAAITRAVATTLGANWLRAFRTRVQELSMRPSAELWKQLAAEPVRNA